MKKFEHENVLKVIGIAYNPSCYVEILLPLMDLGDLKTYVSDNRHYISQREATKFTLDVAEGMRYLSRKHVIHRDLAARNCLLGKIFRNKKTFTYSAFPNASHVFEMIFR